MPASMQDIRQQIAAVRARLIQAMYFIGIDGLVIALLLACLCLRVWGMGPMHTDDAVWALHAHQPAGDPIGDWARSQGRVWAFPIGSLMLGALFWEGTPLESILKLGSFAIFFVSFFAVVSSYWGRRTAGFTGCLFLGLFALRWEGSAFTTYPLLVWPSATLCAFAILAGRYYFLSGAKALLALNILFLFAALFNNEGVAVLVCVLFACSVLGNLAIEKSFLEFKISDFTRGRFRDLTLVSIGVPAVYVLLAVGWMITHPSKYGGHSLAAFDVDKTSSTLLNFALSGSLLYDLIIPYKVVYADALTNTGTAIVYSIYDYVYELAAYPGTILIGAMTVYAAFVTLRRMPERGLTVWRFIPLILVGGIITFLPILPVAMTEKYQTLCLEYGINSYVMTILSHFGVSMMIAGILMPFAPPRGLGLVIALALAILLGAFATVGSRMNDAIAADMRPEAGRWRVLALALKTIDATRQTSPIIFAPRFRSGTWFTVVPGDYWTTYVRAKYKRPVQIYTKPSEIAASSEDIAALDYQLLDNERRFVFSIAHITGDTGNRHIDSISVTIERMDPSVLANYVLSFQDQDGMLVQKRLVDMPTVPADFRIRLMSNLNARLDTVRVTKTSILADSTTPEKLN
ncbi:hypothetical protein AB7783_03275 [Tardiphaga sp. 172_B4_N1_3]|uniref:hypothetical protein n=1 Tax=Tardiphaga sp. 172_B4_N1_3 TaxID=3240787 RepID=UPI003F8A82A2